MDVRVVILKGQGNTFSAGADLSYLQKISENGPEENLADSRRLRDLLWKIYTFPKFTIAQVHGAALAGGCGLATVCDVIFAADDSEFGYTETAIGFIPALVSIFLVRKIGEQHARELLLSARKISAGRSIFAGTCTICCAMRLARHGSSAICNASIEEFPICYCAYEIAACRTAWHEPRSRIGICREHERACAWNRGYEKGNCEFFEEVVFSGLPHQQKASLRINASS